MSYDPLIATATWGRGTAVLAGQSAAVGFSFAHADRYSLGDSDQLKHSAARLPSFQLVYEEFYSVSLGY